MDVSCIIKTAHAAISSPDGHHIACVEGNQICIRRLSTLEILRTINLPPSPTKYLAIRWASITRGAGASNRFLLAEEDVVRVWDLQDWQWSATIDNGSSGLGKIANAEFGHDDSEVLVFSGLHAQVSIWSLWTGRSVEIKDPKFAAKGHGRNRVFALLSRPAAQDIVTLHAPGSYSVIRSIALPTNDAQGLKWSPDGRWLAVWDCASTGYKVLIYTADGHLYRTYTGDYYEDYLVGLGVKTIEWSPSGDFLAVGGYEKNATLLSTKTFSPAVHIAHNNNVSPYSSTIHLEQATSASPSSRHYTLATVPTSPPIAPPSQQSSQPQLPAIGTSLLTFNTTGTLLATKSDAHPTTVWIWDLCTLRSRAILIQHNIIKRLAWHHSDPDLLLIQCIQGDGALYLWNARASIDSAPRVISLPQEARLTGKAEARWLPASSPRKKPALLYGDAHASLVVWPDGREPASPQLNGVHTRRDVHGQATASDGEGDESLFDIVSGQPDEEHGANGRMPQVDPTVAGDFDEHQGAALQDTFDFRRGVDVF